MRGRQFMGHNYGTAATAELMEEKNTTRATDCEVWKMDIDHYNRTGEVRKLEFLRTEERPKVDTLHRKGAHFVYGKGKK